MARNGLVLFLASAAFADNRAVFDTRLQALLKAHCGGCHGGASPASDLSISGYDALLKGGKHGAAIVPGDARASRMVQAVRGEIAPRMPLGGSLPESVIAEIEAAIGAMARESAASKPAVAWAFRKPRLTPGKKSIDDFIAAARKARGLSAAPAADRRALIRRVYFDLIGLPPAPEDVRTFTADTDPKAYENLIDKLLADARYGERWARHWLDLARFAESDGFAIDGERPTAWRYRDYVIRSFNGDKPYDAFIKEQLAGDEGAGDRSERLVALGFLRMSTWEADANFKTQLRQDFLNEVTATTAQVFLGLTVGCARCHNHKYDPIPQRDFYRMQAFFAATKVDDRPAPYGKPDDPALMKRLARQYEDDAEAAAEDFRKIEQELKARHKGVDIAKAAKDRKSQDISDDERRAYEQARDRSRRLSDAAPRYRAVAYAVSDVTPPAVPAVADTFVLNGGELSSKGEKVEPGFPECIEGKSEAAKIPFAGGSSGRRSALAAWIASPDNPLTARVMVNRIWQHHFGEGLVRTPSDFGRNGDKPSHPELLDWLAIQFVEKKWSIKAMHKLMLLSEAYRQSTAHPEASKYAEADPDNRLLWRMNWLRLESETLRDAILAVSGRLQKGGGGPGAFLDIPADVAEGFEFFKWFPSEEKLQLRRSIYAFQRRSVVLPLMEVFDAANMSESCARRGVTTVAPQAFTLLNGEFTHSEARHFAARVRELAGPDRERQIERAFELALGRAPLPAESRRAAGAELERLAVVLFNLNEFLYLE